MNQFIKTKSCFYVALAIFIFDFLKAQTITSQGECNTQQNSFRCANEILLKRNLDIDPKLIFKLDSINEIAKHILSNKQKSSSSAPYTIPVVFHVVVDAMNQTPVPSYEQIKMQLATLNAAFSNSLVSLNHSQQGSQAVDTQIKFCFAKKISLSGSPHPWPTNEFGVIVHYTQNSQISNVNINDNNSLSALAGLGSAQFPSSEYLNIWCVPNICTTSSATVNDPPGIIGFGTYPWMTLPIDGVIMRNDCIGNDTYHEYSSSMLSALDKGEVLTHQVGHYLGLFHTFETIINANISTTGGMSGCFGLNSPNTDGDLIYDTPPTKITSALPVTSYASNYNTCNETYFPYGNAAVANENDQMENFMCYSDDEILNTFTSKQKERMWGALDVNWSTTFLIGQRAMLVSSTNLSFTGVTSNPPCGPGLLSAAFNYSIVTVTCSVVTVKFLQPYLPGYISATTYTWDFGDGTMSTQLNPIHAYSVSPYSYSVTLIVSDGTNHVDTTFQIKLPGGLPSIVDWSGKNIPVCRGSRQSILIKFPKDVVATMLTDGNTSYLVEANAVATQTGSSYTMPFTFPVYSSGSWSLTNGNCGGMNTAATFTVVDCCNNLVYNGDLEAGLTGFSSSYTLTTNLFNGGNAAINNPFNLFLPAANTTKQFMVDAFDVIETCSDLTYSQILLAQNLSGLEPSTDYYLAFESNQSADSIGYICGTTLKLNFGCNSSPNLFSKKIKPNNYISSSVGHAVGILPKTISQVHAFKITSPSNITSATVFYLEIQLVEGVRQLGFDISIDNIMVAPMKDQLKLLPLSQTVSCPSGTMQLNAQSGCLDISSYLCTWHPSNLVSCTSCSNPIVNASVTTVFTLVAIPPSSTPPTPAIVKTSTLFVASPAIQTTIYTITPCFPTSYSLCLQNALTATWQPGNTVGLATVVSPTSIASYTAFAIAPYNQTVCPVQNVISLPLSFMSHVYASAQKTFVCKGETINLYASGANTYTWSTGQTGSIVSISPMQQTNYSVSGLDGLGCPATSSSLNIVVGSCQGLEEVARNKVLALYPNPFNDRLMVEMEDAMPYAIYSIDGKLVMQGQLVKGTNALNTEALKLGLYIVACGKNRNIVRYRLVKAE